jgi:uncharacterized membrane protein
MTAPTEETQPVGRTTTARDDETARLTALSDAVFALAATLLVVTLEVPSSYADLRETMSGFPAFAVGFGAILSLWYVHRQFFARYPIGDAWTTAINGVLLFIVLLYVYPLKLMAEVVADRLLGLGPSTTPTERHEIQGLLVIFGIAVVATAVVMLGLHLRAWQRRRDLALDERDLDLLRVDAIYLVSLGAIALLSMLTAALGIGISWALPLWLYLLPTVGAIVQAVFRTQRRER